MSTSHIPHLGTKGLLHCPIMANYASKKSFIGTNISSNVLNVLRCGKWGIYRK